MTTKTPGHYTESGTRKYQANGLIAWSAVFKRAAGAGVEGEGIRAALAFAAVEHEKEFVAWALRTGAGKRLGGVATRAPKGPKASSKAPKAPRGPKASSKAPKAPKGPKASSKAPKAPKGPKASSKAPEQLTVPGTEG